MAFKYDYTRLLASNFRACFLFYRDVMGFKATYGYEEDVYADFDTGSVAIALFDRKKMSAALGTTQLPERVIAQERMCLIFRVENVDEVSQNLKQQGVQFVTEPADHPDWGIRAAHFRDPDDNLIEIYSPLRSE